MKQDLVFGNTYPAQKYISLTLSPQQHKSIRVCVGCKTIHMDTHEFLSCQSTRFCFVEKGLLNGKEYNSLQTTNMRSGTGFA